jgi:hypothetical protein
MGLLERDFNGSLGEIRGRMQWAFGLMMGSSVGLMLGFMLGFFLSFFGGELNYFRSHAHRVCIHMLSYLVPSYRLVPLHPGTSDQPGLLGAGIFFVAVFVASLVSMMVMTFRLAAAQREGLSRLLMNMDRTRAAIAQAVSPVQSTPPTDDIVGRG